MRLLMQPSTERLKTRTLPLLSCRTWEKRRRSRKRSLEVGPPQASIMLVIINSQSAKVSWLHLTTILLSVRSPRTSRNQRRLRVCSTNWLSIWRGRYQIAKSWTSYLPKTSSCLLKKARLTCKISTMPLLFKLKMSLSSCLYQKKLSCLQHTSHKRRR